MIVKKKVITNVNWCIHLSNNFCEIQMKFTFWIIDTQKVILSSKLKKTWFELIEMCSIFAFTIGQIYLKHLGGHKTNCFILQFSQKVLIAFLFVFHIFEAQGANFLVTLLYFFFSFLGLCLVVATMRNWAPHVFFFPCVCLAFCIVARSQAPCSFPDIIFLLFCLVLTLFFVLIFILFLSWGAWLNWLLILFRFSSLSCFQAPCVALFYVLVPFSCSKTSSHEIVR
jgi:hypothetical protein